MTTFKLSTLGKTSQKRWIEKVETRLSVTSSMLGDIKAVKMLGLTDKLFDIIHRLQWVEIETSKRFRKIFIGQVFFCEYYFPLVDHDKTASTEITSGGI